MNPSRRMVFLLLGVSLLALLVTGSEIYSRLAYLWAFLLLGSWLWSLLSLQGVEVRRTPQRRRAHMGQIFEERFEIINRSRLLKVWLEVRDLSGVPGSRGSHVVTLLGGHQRRAYLARTRLVQRGVFPLGPTLLASGDPFGLFPVKREFRHQDVLLVYPMMVELRAFPSPAGLLSGGEALRRRTHYVTPNAAGVREYMPGDSLNRIHWPTTARRDRLMVKEFELDPLADIWVFVDGEKVVQAAQPYSMEALSRRAWLLDLGSQIGLPPSTEEYAASIAASVSQFYLRRRRAVGLVLSGQVNTVLPPDRGGRQLGKILEALALFRSVGRLPISGLVEAQSQHIARGSTVVLITPTVREGFASVVEYLVRRGLRPLVILLEAQSFGGAPGTQQLEVAIRSLGVPMRRVVNGDDLGEALMMPL